MPATAHDLLLVVTDRDGWTVDTIRLIENGTKSDCDERIAAVVAAFTTTANVIPTRIERTERTCRIKQPNGVGLRLGIVDPA